MDPINYSGAFAPVNPAQAVLQGLQVGSGITQVQQQQQAQQLALQQQQQQQAALQALMNNPNPTASDYAKATLAVPGMREQFKQAWDMKSSDQQQSTLSDIAQVHAALAGGQPEYAATYLENRANALENAGAPKEQVEAARNMAGVVRANPRFAQTLTGMKLASVPGGDKAITSLSALDTNSRANELQPAAVQKANAEATTASVAAGNAPTKTVLDNQKTAEDIKSAQLKRDIDQIDVQIRGADSQTKLGELQLQRDKLNAELAKIQQGQSQSAQDSQNATTNALETLGQIKDHPGMRDAWYQFLGSPAMSSKPGSTWGAIIGHIPGTDRNALQGWVDSLRGQLSYQNLMAMKSASPSGASGLGALSEGEMKMLSGIAGNLDLDSKDFPKQLARVESFLKKAQATNVSRPGLPNSGEAFVMKHPQYDNVTEGTINAIMRLKPGATRADVLQFLQQTGGQ